MCQARQLGEGIPLFISEKIRWRRRPAETCDDLSALGALLISDTARRLADIYSARLDEANGAVPTKESFPSWMLKGDLANVILYDLVDREDLVFRVVGEAIKARFGFNPDGRSYLEFVPPERQKSALQAFRLCADTPCAMHVLVRQGFANGGHADCEVLGVPLAENEGDRDGRFLLFVNKVIESANAPAQDLRDLQVAEILSRRFVDIGFGCPAGFHDLVPR